jgi:hypothetical protein
VGQNEHTSKANPAPYNVNNNPAPYNMNNNPALCNMTNSQQHE